MLLECLEPVNFMTFADYAGNVPLHVVYLVILRQKNRYRWHDIMLFD